MASTTKQMQVQAGNAQATVNATVTDGMPAVPCPDPAGYRYVGARYVPKFADPIEWNSRTAYEPLTIVIHEGNSYTSKSYVPAGIDIANDTYWVATGNYNGQLQHLIDQVNRYLTDIDANTEAIAQETADRTAADDKIEDQITGLMASVGGLSSDPPVFVSSTGEMTDKTKVYVLTTNGHVYAYNGESFVDTGVDYGVANAVHYDRLINPKTAEAPYNDANTLPMNTVCVLYGGDTAIGNMPSKAGGTIITYGGNNWKTQIYIEAGDLNRAYYRYFHGNGDLGQLEWIELVSENTVNETVDMSYGSISLFKTVGVIGDSFASGWTKGGNRSLDISWPQIMGRKCGIDVENFTRTGATFESWMADDEYGLPALQAADAKQLYLVALGINEQRLKRELGTSADMTGNPVDNPNTFYGNADKAIYYIKQKAPKAKIIIIGLAIKSTDYNTALMEVADHNSIPFINTQNDVYFTSSYYKSNMVGAHPVSITYSGMADAYARLVAETFSTNSSYYSDYIGG